MLYKYLLLTDQKCVLVIFSKRNDMTALEEEHLATKRKLQESQMNSLSKMGDIVTELER